MSYLAPFPRYGSLLVKFSLATVDDLTLTPSLGWSLRMSWWALPHRKLEWLCYLTVKTAWSYLHSCGQNTGTWRTDWQTDRETDLPRLLYSDLHCKQYGRAVRTIVGVLLKLCPPVTTKSAKFSCRVEIGTLLSDVHLHRHKTDIKQANTQKPKP